MYVKILTTMFMAAGMLPAAQPDNAAKLMAEIKSNAGKIQSVAMDLEKLSQNRGAKWNDYDQRWNEIKPHAEELSMELGRLEAMQTSLSASDKQEVDHIKPLINQIETKTDELHGLLGQLNVDPETPELKANARSLARESGSLVREVASETGASKKS
jgi:hypothetical protein